MSMSPVLKRIESTEPQASSHRVTETNVASAPSSERFEEIRRRAYEIYLERGEQPGREVDDWLQAERELRPGVLWQAD
jgi:hypothetical protein